MQADATTTYPHTLWRSTRACTLQDTDTRTNQECLRTERCPYTELVCADTRCRLKQKIENVPYRLSVAENLAVIAHDAARTDALMGVGVVHVSAVARTVEASGSVHARSVIAHVRHQCALVNFFGPVGHRVHDQARPRPA